MGRATVTDEASRVMRSLVARHVPRGRLGHTQGHVVGGEGMSRAETTSRVRNRVRIRSA